MTTNASISTTASHHIPSGVTPWRGQLAMLHQINESWLHNRPAIVMAASRTGKTTLAVDIVHPIRGERIYASPGRISERGDLITKGWHIMSHDELRRRIASRDRRINADAYIVIDDVFCGCITPEDLRRLGDVCWRTLAIGTPRPDSIAAWSHDQPRYPLWVARPVSFESDIDPHYVHDPERAVVDVGCLIARPDHPEDWTIISNIVGAPPVRENEAGDHAGKRPSTQASDLKWSRSDDITVAAVSPTTHLAITATGYHLVTAGNGAWFTGSPRGLSTRVSGILAIAPLPDPQHVVSHLPVPTTDLALFETAYRGPRS